jgi:hypothetical protein
VHAGGECARASAGAGRPAFRAGPGVRARRGVFAFAWAFAAAGMLAGCASLRAGAGGAGAPHDALDVPQLRLAPVLLGRSLDLQQHITVHAAGHEQQLDVLLEADARHVQLGVVAMGQVAARLDWDGTTLTENRAPWWPQAVSGSRILSDLQLTLWPVAAIQSALPAGWRLVEAGATRTLSENGAVVTVVTHVGPRIVEIDQQRRHYRLTIESQEIGAAAPPSAADSAAERP